MNMKYEGKHHELCGVKDLHRVTCAVLVCYVEYEI
jgi:hypothetical protein